LQQSLVFWNQMAAVAACRRLGRLRTNSGIGLTGFGGYYGVGAPKFSPSISGSMYYSHFGKLNGQRLFLVDTLALVIHIPLLYFFTSYYFHVSHSNDFKIEPDIEPARHLGHGSTILNCLNGQ